MSLLDRKQDRLVTVHEQFTPLGQTKGSFVAFELNEMKIKGRKFTPEGQKYTTGNRNTTYTGWRLDINAYPVASSSASWEFLGLRDSSVGSRSK